MHCHTTGSDGKLNPQELITRARDRWVEFLCITDHDRSSCDLVDEIKKAGMLTLPSVEITTLDEHRGDQSLHLTYYAQHISDDIKKILEATRAEEEVFLEEQIRILQQAGFVLDEQDFYATHLVNGREKSGILMYELARYLAAQEVNTQKFAELGCDGWKPHSALYTKYLKKGWLLRPNIWNYEPSTAVIAEIAEADGWVLAIAHPNFSFSHEGAGEFARLYDERYRKLWIKAIEINTRATKRWIDVIMAKKATHWDGLQVTFGSDFHQEKLDDKHGDLGFENQFVSPEFMIREVWNFQDRVWI